jgi:hypothetical protein
MIFNNIEVNERSLFIYLLHSNYEVKNREIQLSFENMKRRFLCDKKTIDLDYFSTFFELGSIVHAALFMT